ncbi:50S ribosomal protein L34 [bacterium (Candidatus Gribaldobacteria) CG_4_8_14_3_um_filter_42_11]|uniref:Large ribosomal subunit protein bL34 n=1 Tax=bacterium (Candidatus Gribaldobacteria) CG_4_8_14_3_um_filter_42_11 TaxID=2014267 RepID=A0A2M7IXG0_9BACT|nr:MAG: 50S ribosomal protein L34 [Parcubacteria group bacterium CG1_02_41_26]PIX02850.1 MAG: 50S ribosomal protein L34 [bacterium (Candidatus Gribaldobacteria) CG_4_8_14_3_um_filter_42_11]
MSFTYKPKKKKRQRTHGFLARTATKGGQRAIAKRRAKGRKKLAV